MMRKIVKIESGIAVKGLEEFKEYMKESGEVLRIKHERNKAKAYYKTVFECEKMIIEAGGCFTSGYGGHSPNRFIKVLELCGVEKKVAEKIVYYSQDEHSFILELPLNSSWNIKEEEDYIKFKNEEHKKFFVENANHADCYKRALIYALGIDEVTRTHIHRIYNAVEGQIKPECLIEGWQTGSSMKVTRLAFNLFNNYRYEVESYLSEDDDVEIMYDDSFTPASIFCSTDMSYFFEAVKIRFEMEYTN